MLKSKIEVLIKYIILLDLTNRILKIILYRKKINWIAGINIFLSCKKSKK